MPKNSFVLVAMAALFCSFTGAPPAAASAPAPNPHVWLKPRPWSPLVPSSRLPGLWISRNPVDGTLGMPSPELLSSLAAPARLDEQPLQVVHGADGSTTVMLDDRWASYAVATRGADHAPRWTCVSGRRGVEQFMAIPVIAAPAPAPAVEVAER